MDHLLAALEVKARSPSLVKHEHFRVLSAFGPGLTVHTPGGSPILDAIQRVNVSGELGVQGGFRCYTGIDCFARKRSGVDQINFYHNMAFISACGGSPLLNLRLRQLSGIHDTYTYALVTAR